MFPTLIFACSPSTMRGPRDLQPPHPASPARPAASQDQLAPSGDGGNCRSGRKRLQPRHNPFSAGAHVLFDRSDSRQLERQRCLLCHGNTSPGTVYSRSGCVSPSSFYMFGSRQLASHPAHGFHDHFAASLVQIGQLRFAGFYLGFEHLDEPPSFPGRHEPQRGGSPDRGLDFGNRNGICEEQHGTACRATP